MYLELTSKDGKKTEAFFDIGEITIKENLLEPGEGRVYISVDGLHNGILEFRTDEMENIISALQGYLHTVKDSKVIPGET